MTLSTTAQAPKLFVATKAFINHGGKILILRESNQYLEGTNAGLFDITGGRITPGERFDDCLIREIHEETGLDVKIGRPFFVSEWRPVVKGEKWQVVGIFFECFTDSKAVILSDDHSEHKWIEPSNFRDEYVIPNLHTAFEAYLRFMQPLKSFLGYFADSLEKTTGELKGEKE